MIRTLAALVALAVLPATALAAELPAHLDLAPPFPSVTLQAPQIERIAPGIEYGDYELWSEVGPISVHVIAADLSNPSVRVNTVLAGDALESDGESVTSMATRTDAVAGINGDYFDIGQTNRPTNIVVRDGALLRTPRKRYALAILRSGSAHFAEFAFGGSVQVGTQSFPLEGVNEMPSTQDTLTLLTPAFGNVPQSAGFTLVSLTLTNGSPPLAAYRAEAFSRSADGAQPPGYYLVVGSDLPDALPNAGDAVAASGSLSPVALGDLSAAIGGGPLILYAGQWYDDPDGPRGGEFDRRIPCSGAAIESDGTLLLIEVDGRQEERSVGLTRPEFAELMRALGARDGIALDGGGSSAVAARLLGESAPLLQSSPSDGTERRIADGIFLYNDSPVGTPDRLAASPEIIRAVPGASVSLHVAAVDANDHPMEVTEPVSATVEPATLGNVSDDRFVAAAPGVGRILLRAGRLEGSVPLEVIAAPERVALLPPEPNVDPHATILMHARAFDASGFEVALPAHLPWKASSGTIDELGHFVAGDRNADIRLDLGGRIASARISVGSREAELGAATELHFLSIPVGGAGSATLDPSCADCIRLTYAIGESERAAYAILERGLPAGSVGVSFDLRDDGGGAELRVALRNAINEQVLVTASPLDQAGSRHVVVHFPPGISGPIRLVGFYVIGTHDAPNPSGSILISNMRALVAGAP